MLKAIIFLLKVIFFSVILLIIALMYGVTLVNLSFNDINISQLYLKYDKELILNIKNLKYKNQIKIDDLKISINKHEKKYQINIINFEQKSSKLKFQTNVLLTYKEIKQLLDEKKKNIVLNNLYLKFDEELSDFIAKKVYIDFSKNTIKAKFLNPSLDSIKLDGTVVSIENKSILRLKIKTKSFLNDNLLNILSHYKVSLPVMQIRGNNDISFNLDYFFNSNKIDISFEVNINNALLKYNDINISSNNFKINLKDNNIKINSKKLIINAFEKVFVLEEMFSNIKDKEINLTYNLEDENNNTYKIKQNVNLNTKYTKGNINIQNYNFDDIVKLKNQELDFNLDFKNDINLNIFSTNDIFLEDINVIVQKPNLNFQNNKINFKTKIKDKNQNIVVFKSNIDLNTKLAKGNVKIQEYKYKKIIDIKNKSFKFNINFKDEILLYIKDFDLLYLKNKQINNLSIGKLNKVLNHIKFIKINKWRDNTSLNLYSEDNFENMNILLSNLDIELKNELFEQDDKEKVKETTNKLLPKVELVLLNSSIELKNQVLTTNYSMVKTIGKKIILKLKPIEETSKINILIDDKKIYMSAKDLSEEFINKLANKKLFKGGSVDFSLNGDINKVEGKLIFKDTTLKNVMVLNNLITFINTTPAIINPILALPTLFRMAETGFDMQGYYIKHGEVDFEYKSQQELLNINKIYTQSNMTDFRGIGEINIKNKTLNFDIDAIFLKDYSSVIKHIPILGYIIVGDSGNFETKVNINGTFKEQKFTTNTVADAIEGVFGVITRTISMPFLPFMDMNSSEEAILESNKAIESIISPQDH